MKHSFRSFVQFLIGSFVFFLFHFEASLYTVNTNPLSDMFISVLQIFSPVAYIFIFLSGSGTADILNFDQAQFIFHLWLFMAKLKIHLEKGSRVRDSIFLEEKEEKTMDSFWPYLDFHFKLPSLLKVYASCFP